MALGFIQLTVFVNFAKGSLIIKSIFEWHRLPAGGKAAWYKNGAHRPEACATGISCIYNAFRNFAELSTLK
jgi:hypothetical protein